MSEIISKLQLFTSQVSTLVDWILMHYFTSLTKALSRLIQLSNVSVMIRVLLCSTHHALVLLPHPQTAVTVFFFLQSNIIATNQDRLE